MEQKVIVYPSHIKESFLNKDTWTEQRIGEMGRTKRRQYF